jgi:hypothetical protein
MSFKKVETTAGSAIATSGTVTFAYPAGTNAGSFAAFGHKLWVDKFQRLLESPSNFTVSFGASLITVTYLGATSIPAGARLAAQFNILGVDSGVPEIVPKIENVNEMAVVRISLGAPIVGDVDGLVTGYSGAAGAIPMNGALVSGGVATFDVPRAVVVDSGGADTSVITITGTDVFGQVMKENITTNGTTAVNGKKAFKTVTGISGSLTAANGIFIGTTNILGLPVFLPGSAHILKEILDGAAATAGTVVAGVSTAATATTGDVRGTYVPNSAPDGTRVFDLIVALGDPDYKGVAQFSA